MGVRAKHHNGRRELMGLSGRGNGLELATALFHGNCRKEEGNERNKAR
jgi:hypothetical protein